MRIVFACMTCFCFASLSYAQCGGNFSNFVEGLKTEASDFGYRKQDIQAFFGNVTQDQKVLKADRNQGVFQKDFIAFSSMLISEYRMVQGRKNAVKHSDIFQEIEWAYGIPAGVLLAFWAFETDFGANQGGFNTLNALATLAHDCRRPGLFRPQVFAALELSRRGGFNAVETKGAWAGEIGMIQMLPQDILENGFDGDADGKVDLQNSVADALFTGARMLNRMGWEPGGPWLQEITVPYNLDWSSTGVGKPKSIAEWKSQGVRGRNESLSSNQTKVSVVLPVGHKGPAFLTYPNFDVYFEWNQSLVYVTTAAYFANLLMGAPPYDAGIPEPGLKSAAMKTLQKKLQLRGHDVGDVDGILGAKTRAAVQFEQQRLGLPADAWPTATLLNQL